MKKWLFYLFSFDVQAEGPFGTFKTRAFLKDGVLTIERYQRAHTGWDLIGNDIFHLEGDLK